MLVEDENDVANLVKLNLERLNENILIKTFNSALEAMKALEDKSIVFNLIISDYNMPEMDGIKFLEKIRDNRILTPFIIFTGLNQDELESVALKAGATYFIKKGNDFNKTISELNRFINFIFRQHRKSLKEGITTPILQNNLISFDKSEHLDLILQNIDFGLYVLDLRGELIFANKKAALDLGYDSVDKLYSDKSNKDIFDILDIYNPKYFDFLTKQFSFRSNDELLTDELININVHNKLESDHEKNKWFLKKVTPIFSQDYTLQFVTISTYDMSNLMKNEYESHRELQYGLLLNNCLDLVFHVYDEKDFLDSICKLLVEKSRFILVWVGSAEVHHNQKIVIPIASYGFQTDYLDNIKVNWDDSPAGMGPVGKAIRSGSITIVNDINNDKDFLPWRDNALSRGYQSCLAIPIRFDHESGTQGSLNIYSSQKNAFQEKDISFLNNLSRLLTTGIHILRTGTKLLEDDETFNNFPIALIKANIDDLFEMRKKVFGSFREYFDKHAENVVMIIKSIKITKANKKTIELFKDDFAIIFSNFQRIFPTKSIQVFKEILIAFLEGKKEIIRKISFNSQGTEVDAIIKIIMETKLRKPNNQLLIALIPT